MRHHSPTSEEDQALTARKRSTWEILVRVSRYLGPYKTMAAATLGCAILSLACSFVYPRLITFIIDDVIGNKNAQWLMPATLGLVGAFFFRDLFNSIRIRINNVFEQNVIFDMRRDVYGKLQRLPVSYFDPRSSGDLMTRVIEDVNSVERVLIDGTEQGVIAILSIIGVTVLLFMANVQLALVAFVPIPLLIAGALAYTLTAHHRYRVQRQASSAMNALLMDNLQGVRQIKAYAHEKHEDSRFASRAHDLREGTLGVMRAWALYSPAMGFAAALGTVLVLWIGGKEVLNGTMQLGELVGFVFYLNLFYDPVNRLHGLNQMLQAARAAGERVFDILDTPEEGKDPQRTLRFSERARGEVHYRNVSFSYQSERAILKNISLRAKPGEMIALVGPTGAGKSTLVNLMPGFYKATEGSIQIDGLEVNRIALDSLREQISIVSQEPFLFNGTIRENIEYGKLGSTSEEIIQAATMAHCHEFIQSLPEGYESRVGERGVKLSVGEKQRISIARALLKNSPILILDEATASVDTATERLIQDALQRLMENRTSFVIAHRLSTIRTANQILVLRHGEIIEQGTHEELINSEGLYARLCRIQNTTFIEEGFVKLGEEN